MRLLVSLAGTADVSFRNDTNQGLRVRSVSRDSQHKRRRNAALRYQFLATPATFRLYIPLLPASQVYIGAPAPKVGPACIAGRFTDKGCIMRRFLLQAACCVFLVPGTGAALAGTENAAGCEVVAPMIAQIVRLRAGGYDQAQAADYMGKSLTKFMSQLPAMPDADRKEMQRLLVFSVEQGIRNAYAMPMSDPFFSLEGKALDTEVYKECLKA